MIVEKILIAVNSYYAQFEPGAEAGVAEMGEFSPNRLLMHCRKRLRRRR